MSAPNNIPWKARVLPIVFVLFLLLPLANEWLNLLPDTPNRENRSLAEMPVFKWSKLDRYPKKFNSYFQDHFSFRNRMTAWHGSMVYQVFKKSPQPNQVILGKDGWFFLARKEKPVYMGYRMFTAEQLKTLGERLEYNRQFLADRGCKYYFVMAPMKHEIYPEFLPASAQKFVAENMADQLANYVQQNTNINYLDLREPIRKAKSDLPLYYYTDNHWNRLGGFHAYRAIGQMLQEDFPNISLKTLEDFTIETEPKKPMTAARLLGASIPMEELNIILVPKFQRLAQHGEEQNYPAPEKFPYPKQYEVVRTVPNSNQPRLLMIRDSFGAAVLPILSEHFSKSVYIFDSWTYSLNEPIVEQEQPDIYIHMVLETHLINMVQDPSTLTF